MGFFDILGTFARGVGDLGERSVYVSHSKWCRFSHHECLLLRFRIEGNVARITVFVVELLERCWGDSARFRDGFGYDGASNPKLIIFIRRSDVIGGQPYLILLLVFMIQSVVSSMEISYRR